MYIYIYIYRIPCIPSEYLLADLLKPMAHAAGTALHRLALAGTALFALEASGQGFLQCLGSVRWWCCCCWCWCCWWCCLGLGLALGLGLGLALGLGCCGLVQFLDPSIGAVQNLHDAGGQAGQLSPESTHLDLHLAQGPQATRPAILLLSWCAGWQLLSWLQQV